MTLTKSRALAAALVAAEEYRALVMRGDVVMADQVKRTIEDLVGRWTSPGRWDIPEAVRQAMRGDMNRWAR